MNCQIFFLLLAALLPFSSHAYRILFMGPFPAPSHWMWLENFQNDLLHRGHQLTSINNHPAKHVHTNLTEIIIDPKFDIPFHCKLDEIFINFQIKILYNLQCRKRTFLKCAMKAIFKLCKCGGVLGC